MNFSTKLIGALLLFTYFTYVFRVLIPLINYSINYNYIVEELCKERELEDNTCLGKCHLANEIKKQVDPITNNTQIPQIDLLKIPHFMNSNKNEFINDFSTISFQKNSAFLIYSVIKPIIPPPKQFC